MKCSVALLTVSTLLSLAAPGLAAPATTAPAAPQRPAVVVLDPGHGGANTGAPGFVPGSFEKQVTLKIARLVAKSLEERGMVPVLTRDRDRYLTLRQRARRANELDADVFVSIHANASPGAGQTGFETYVLSPRALDVDSRALRADEARPRPGLDPRAAFLVADIERGAVQTDAADMAHAIQSELSNVRGQRGNRGVKQESMHVLLGATMPSVLVEVGFLDHPVEGRELLEDSVQAAIATAIADGIVKAHRR